MTDRPILFSAPMVIALLAGTKTQTRRVLKPLPRRTIFFDPKTAGKDQFQGPRIQPGDRLWVRERGHLLSEAYDHDPQLREDLWRDAGFQHLADGAIVPARDYDPPIAEWIDDCDRLSRSSIHMPRWASRLTLYVTDVRVQRLQDISEADARAEGAGLYVPGHGFITEDELRADPGYSNFLAPCLGFEAIWTEINGPGSWAENPWVAAYTFIPRLGNIDTLPATLEEAA